MRRILKLIFSGSLIMFMVSSICFAGEIDLLLQKLVEKGIFTPGEAQQIKTETQEQIKKEIAE
ncbi:MAG: hypothetical protein N2Z79_03935, partial [Candidatus Omnitrophica bacterium]|nr:hypothetical protein [Candidatus Omnitrophota bacterium]